MHPVPADGARPLPAPVPAAASRQHPIQLLGPVPVAAGAYLLLHLAWLAAGWGGVARRVLIADLFLLPLFALVAAFAWRAGSRPALPAQTRRAWRWLALCYATLWVGNVCWTANDLLLPSDHLYVAGRVLVVVSYVPLLVGLLSFPTAPQRAAQRVTLSLDLATVLLGFGLVLWELVVRPAVDRPAEDTLGFILSFLVPGFDLAVIAALCALMLRQADRGTGLALALLAGGHTISVTAGLVGAVLGRFGLSSGPGHWIDGLWMLSSVLMLSAAAVQSRTAGVGAGRHAATRAHADRVETGDPLRYLPLAGALLGSALLVVVSRPWWGTSVGVVIFGSVAVTALVLARQLVTLQHHRRAETALIASEERYRRLVDDLSEVVFRTDAAGRWAFLNPAWSEITGFAVGESLGRPFVDSVHPDDQAATREAFAPFVSGATDECHLEVRYVTAGGNVRWVHGHVRADRDAAGALIGTFGTLVDVTDRRALEDQLRHQAYHDGLTGLPNRALFCERLARALGALDPDGRGRGVSVLYVDLDDFKLVNDRHGHAAGDQLLVQAAQRLLDATRGSDTVARIGGDEFAILLRGASEGDALVVAERVVAALRTPFAVEGATVRVGASVGLARALDAGDVDAVLRRADAAMYRAKGSGKGRHAVDPSLGGMPAPAEPPVPVGASAD